VETLELIYGRYHALLDSYNINSCVSAACRYDFNTIFRYPFP